MEFKQRKKKQQTNTQTENPNIFSVLISFFLTDYFVQIVKKTFSVFYSLIFLWWEGRFFFLAYFLEGDGG